MIVCNGVVGLCLLVGGLRHRVLAFRVEGTSPALASLAALAASRWCCRRSPRRPPARPTAARNWRSPALTSLALYGVFVFVQTVRHRDYFLPVEHDDDEEHAAPPSDWVAWTSLGLLMLSLVAVVGLAKALAPALESRRAAAGRRLRWSAC